MSKTPKREGNKYTITAYQNRGVRVPSEAHRVSAIIGLGVINQSIYHNKGVKLHIQGDP